MKFDDLIINYLGEFGTYQKIKFFLVCLPTIITAMHALSWTFAASPTYSRCRLPNEPATADYWSPAVPELLEEDTKECKIEENPSWKHCQYMECQMGNLTSCPNGYIFDHSAVAYSAIERWEIKCDRNILKAVIQTMYYIGQMLGSLIFGFLGDRIGRKKVFFIAIILQIFAGCGMIVAPHWIIYSFFRLIVGFAHPGIFVIAVVIGTELVGPSKRRIASVFTGMFFSIGQMLLGVIAFHVRNYQHLQAAIALPAIIFISYWWIIPESARWLVSQKRYAEADLILQRVAKANKTQLPANWWEEIDEPGVKSTNTDDGPQQRSDSPAKYEGAKILENRRQHNFFDLLRTPKIRRISLTIFFCWPVVSMVYYGLSMNPNFLGGNLYINFIFGAFMEIPAVIIVYFMINRVGRKPLLAGGFIISSLCALSSLLIKNAEVNWIMTGLTISQYLIAKCAITITYATIYTFTPELFPTVIRNTAMGVCSMLARVGAILGSYISFWLVDIAGKSVMVIPFSTLGILAGILALVVLPETKGVTLPETIEQIEGDVQNHELELLSSSNPKKSSSPELSRSKTNE